MEQEGNFYALTQTPGSVGAVFKVGGFAPHSGQTLLFVNSDWLMFQPPAPDLLTDAEKNSYASPAVATEVYLVEKPMALLVDPTRKRVVPLRHSLANMVGWSGSLGNTFFEPQAPFALP